RLDRASWVVKGGVNLRAWFGSLRYSEDLDLDLVRGSVLSLREKVDKLLASGRSGTCSAPKVFGWCGAPSRNRRRRPSGGSSSSKRRAAPFLCTPAWSSAAGGATEEFVLAPVRPEIVQPYGLPAPTANHYTARAALRQRIEALAGRAQTQARDVWDLDYLLRTTGATPGPLTPAQGKTLAAALERAMGLPFEVYKAQVVPYQVPHVVYVASLARTKRIKTEVADYSIHRLAPRFFGGVRARARRAARPAREGSARPALLDPCPQPPLRRAPRGRAAAALRPAGGGPLAAEDPQRPQANPGPAETPGVAWRG
ncbi:MAG TPA: nucleotidyl transferase AbiEii/AbiGii toxin family protein, partial [Vicinamibacteria bacterium]|nr:nucleotidyl transferase AbiEii/AbiGii toxin family protein [Vicinamibacteria bacterium]